MESDLKAILFNATDLVDKNPGCRATMAGLRKIIPFSIIKEFPLGFGYEFISDKRPFAIITESYYIKRQIKKVSVGIEKQFQNIQASEIIINAEGSIHSNSKGAIVLCAIALFFINSGKRVHLVNGTIYNLHQVLLGIINKCHTIFVREILSKEYLNNNNIKSKLVYDCAFMLIAPKINNIVLGSCLYTPGVLFSHNKNIDDITVSSLVKSHFSNISESYYKPTFLLIEDKEERLAKLWSELGGDIIDSRNLSLNDLLKIISKFELLISGRYHILLFSFFLKNKKIPLASNTYKIEGLIKTFFKNSDVPITNIFSKSLLDYNLFDGQIEIQRVQSEIQKNYLTLKPFN